MMYKCDAVPRMGSWSSERKSGKKLEKSVCTVVNDNIKISIH